MTKRTDVFVLPDQLAAWRVRRHDSPNYWIIFQHKPVDALKDPEREVQPLYAAPAAQPVAFDAEGFRAWVLRELPDGVVIGRGVWWADHFTKGAQWFIKAAPAAQAAPSDPDEFTNNARNALAWVLWHHQGASSPVGLPIRYALGMSDHEPLSESQITGAKAWAALTRSTHDFDRNAAQAAPAPAPVARALTPGV